MATPTAFGPRTGQRLLDFSRTLDGVQGGQATSMPREFPDGGFTFSNQSGENVPAYACMKITDAVVDAGSYVLQISKPDGTGGPFCFNGPNPVPVPAGDESGRGQAFFGVVKASYSSGTPAAGDVWGPASGSWDIIATGDPILEILGAIESDIALGTMGGAGVGRLFYKAVADSAITDGSSGTVSIWENGVDTGTNVTAHLNWVTGGEDISAGKELVIWWFDDEQKWVILIAECEDPPETPTLTNGTHTLAVSQAPLTLADASSGNVTINTVTPSGNNGWSKTIKRKPGGPGNTVSVVGNTADIDEAASVELDENEAVTIRCDGTEFWIT